MYSAYHGEIQHGKYVDEVLRGYFPDVSYHGVFFDVGAYEPINISNSYHFERNGWDTYCFEANPFLIDELKSHRKNVFNYAIYDEDKPSVTFNVVKGVWGGGSLTAGISAIELDPQYMKKFGSGIRGITSVTVPQKTLNTVITTELPHISHIDILSVDVEGGELKVLQGLDLIKYTPKVVLVENVFNNSDIRLYLERHGYKLDKHIDYNQYYTLA
jgi:FkbM family methyltransferase